VIENLSKGEEFYVESSSGKRIKVRNTGNDIGSFNTVKDEGYRVFPVSDKTKGIMNYFPV